MLYHSHDCCDWNTYCPKPPSDVEKSIQPFFASILGVAVVSGLFHSYLGTLWRKHTMKPLLWSGAANVTCAAPTNTLPS